MASKRYLLKLSPKENLTGIKFKKLGVINLTGIWFSKRWLLYANENFAPEIQKIIFQSELLGLTWKLEISKNLKRLKQLANEVELEFLVEPDETCQVSILRVQAQTA